LLKLVSKEKNIGGKWRKRERGRERKKKGDDNERVVSLK